MGIYLTNSRVRASFIISNKYRMHRVVAGTSIFKSI